MTHYHTLYQVFGTQKHFFTVTERQTGRVIHNSATYDTPDEASTTADQVVKELDAQAARDEEAYLKSFTEGPES
jgi:hypothetical protein